MVVGLLLALMRERRAAIRRRRPRRSSTVTWNDTESGLYPDFPHPRRHRRRPYRFPADRQLVRAVVDRYRHDTRGRRAGTVGPVTDAGEVQRPRPIHKECLVVDRREITRRLLPHRHGKLHRVRPPVPIGHRDRHPRVSTPCRGWQPRCRKPSSDSPARPSVISHRSLFARELRGQAGRESVAVTVMVPSPTLSAKLLPSASSIRGTGRTRG